VVNFYEGYKTSFPTLTVQVPNNHLSPGQRYDVNLAFGTNLSKILRKIIHQVSDYFFTGLSISKNPF
jgi:hypothetical protein